MTQKDSQRFFELLEPFKDELYGFVVKSLIDRSLAEDILQEALFKASQDFIRNFQEGTNFRAWVYKYVVNTLMNANKKRKREQEMVHFTDYPEEGLVSVYRKEEVYQALLHAPERFFDEVSAEVRQALTKLSEVERTVFLLRSVEEFSYKEMAQMMDIPMGTVMSHLFRARVKLREALLDYAYRQGYALEKSKSPSVEEPKD